MLKRVWQSWKHFVYKNLFPFLVVHVGQNLLRLLLWTCKWQIEGLEEFKKTAEKEKCILMLWHNRLVLVPFILIKYAPDFIYTAFVSNSRDGELISSIIHSYKTGRTIRVSHQARHQALKELIHHLETKKEVITMTPDGPRGPRYIVKQGVALAALETSAHIIILNWSSNRMWEMNSWDKLRIPKPFSTIKVFFEKPIVLNKETVINRHEAQTILQEHMINLEK